MLVKFVLTKDLVYCFLKFQDQDSFLEYFFLRFGDLKNVIALSEKKPPLNTQMGPNPFRNRIETVKTFHDRLFFQTFKSVICNEKFCENVS